MHLRASEKLLRYLCPGILTSACAGGRQKGFNVAKLGVSGSFLITIGHGAGPETEVVLSVSDQDGNPKLLDFREPPSDEQPVRVFVALSAMFGAYEISLRIVEVRTLETGFYGLRVEAPKSEVGRLENMRPSALGIVVDDGTDRGQALVCACGGADVTSWFGERTQTPPEG